MQLFCDKHWNMLPESFKRGLRNAGNRRDKLGKQLQVAMREAAKFLMAAELGVKMKAR